MTWKVGDLEPDLAGTFQDDGAPASLAEAVAVRVHIRKPARWDPDLEAIVVPIIDRPAIPGDQGASPGSWSMEWAEGDLDVADVYRVELEVEWAIGRTQTTPTVAFYVEQQIA